MKQQIQKILWVFGSSGNIMAELKLKMQIQARLGLSKRANEVSFANYTIVLLSQHQDNRDSKCNNHYF